MVATMASHLNAVGFGADNLEDVQDLLRVASERAAETGDTVEHADGRTIRYEDPSGATLAIHVDDDGNRLRKRRGRDLNPRRTQRPETVCVTGAPAHHGRG